MQTPATAALDAAGIAYTTAVYDAVDTENVGYGVAMADALGVDPAASGKSLVVALDNGRHVVAVVPVSEMLDLKALARVAGTKRATMATTDVAERLSGSVVGGIAPLGNRRRLAVFIDASLLAGDVVHVSGGRRGVEVSLAPADLVAATNATVASLTL